MQKKQVSLTLEKQISPCYQTDTNFAYDIALTSNKIKEAQLLLQRVEDAAKQIGLYVNDDKTKFMVFNQPEGIITSSKGENLKCVSDFKYLG